MNATELIMKLLEMLGEKTLAQTVKRRLERNEEAALPVQMPGEKGCTGVREVNLHFDVITLDPC